jgi:AcrR family transcriptional regulator
MLRKFIYLNYDNKRGIMKPSKTINTLEFRQLVLKEIYHRFSETKTPSRAFGFLEAAIHCFDKKGFENVTITMIARESGVTRQLLSHYFKDLAEIREVAIKYIRVIGQQLMLQELARENKPDKILLAYLRSHLVWVNNFRSHIRVWLKFLSYCSKKDLDRHLNSVAIKAGHGRIEQIIQQGRTQGVFTHADDGVTATIIQTLIAGWLVILVTEDIENSNGYSEMVMQHIMRTVGIEI